MANDNLLKEVRRLMKVEIDRGEVWRKMDTLLGDNIKEAVLDSEIRVKKQELSAIKQDIASVGEQWGKDREKRKIEVQDETSEFDQLLAKKRKEYESGLVDLKTQAEKKETELKTVIRNNDRNISNLQKEYDKLTVKIKEDHLEATEVVINELADVCQLRDSMKEEIRGMQEKFGMRV